MEHSRITTTHRLSAGFAMLFTVLIVSLILTIAVGISNLTLRQAILSNLAKDSGIAFYQADAGVECGMYQDATLGNFPYQTPDATTPVVPPSSFICGTKNDSSHTPIVMSLDTIVSSTDGLSQSNYYRYIPQDQTVRDSTQPCFSITFDKTNLETTKSYSAVRSSGYSSCTKSPRQVERLLQVTY